MNANRKFTVGALAIAALLLTGCGNDVPSADNAKAYPSQSASASATAPSTTPATPPATAPALDDSKRSENPLGAPAVSEEEAKKNKAGLEAKPLGFDVDAMFNNPERVTADVLTVFPEDKNQTKKVVREAIGTYATLISQVSLQEKRTGDEYALIGAYADKFDADFLNIVKSTIADKGRLDHVQSVPRDGIVSIAGTKYTVVSSKNGFQASFNEPSVEISNFIAYGTPHDVIRITTDMAYSYDLVEVGTGKQKKFTGTSRVTIDVLPTSGGDWIIKEIGNKNLTRDLVDAKVTND